VGYDAAVSRWRGHAMHLPDRATNVLERLLAEPALADGPLVLIGHSLGGLLIKQLLRTAETEAKQRQDAASLLERVEKVAFLATPHSGAGLATLGDRLRILVRPTAAIACLVRNDPTLRDLNLWYKGWANDRKIAHLVLTETRAYKIFGMVVMPDSSDPGLGVTRPVPIDSDHVAITKPPTRASQVFVQIRRFIEHQTERPKDHLAEVADRVKELPAEIAERVVAMLDQRGATARAAEGGLEREAIFKLARRLKPDEVVDNFDQAVKELENGERESGTARLEEAVAAYRAALEERTRDRVPLDWAATQNNLGNALKALGERESGTARLEEAVEAFRAALREYTRDRVPFLWAQTQQNLALVCRALFDKTGAPHHRDDARNAVDGALDEYRKAMADFHIMKAERLREQILAAKGGLPGS
jgi:tetratricopeptide (TPR) repeat protein